MTDTPVEHASWYLVHNSESSFKHYFITLFFRPMTNDYAVATAWGRMDRPDCLTSIIVKDWVHEHAAAASVARYVAAIVRDKLGKGYRLLFVKPDHLGDKLVDPTWHASRTFDGIRGTLGTADVRNCPTWWQWSKFAGPYFGDVISAVPVARSSSVRSRSRRRRPSPYRGGPIPEETSGYGYTAGGHEASRPDSAELEDEEAELEAVLAKRGRSSETMSATLAERLSDKKTRAGHHPAFAPAESRKEEAHVTRVGRFKKVPR